MDQYVSWSLSSEELTLDIIWEKYEEFCKPHLNEVRDRFDLLTSFWQGNKSVDEWYNAVQTQVTLAKYPPETAKILHRDILCFFLKGEEFVSKTINDSNIDLDRFPTSKVRQLAKKVESSKVTTRHIKQVASDPQAAQINLMRHQCTDLPASKYKKRKSFVKPRPPSHKNDTSDRQHSYKKSFDTKNVYRNKGRCQNVEIQITLKVSSVQQRNFNASLVIIMDTSQASVT